MLRMGPIFPSSTTAITLYVDILQENPEAVGDERKRTYHWNLTVDVRGGRPPKQAMQREIQVENSWGGLFQVMDEIPCHEVHIFCPREVPTDLTPLNRFFNEVAKKKLTPPSLGDELRFESEGNAYGGNVTAVSEEAGHLWKAEVTRSPGLTYDVYPEQVIR